VFLVTEAQGPIGAAAVDWLAGRACPVRAAVPDAGRYRRRRKVEPIRFDWSDREGWESALDGIEGIVLISPQAMSGRESILCDFITAASEAGCRRVSFLSAIEAESDRWDRHRKIEEHLRNSGMGWTFLRAGITAQNLVESRRSGIGSLEIAFPVGVGCVAWVDPRDVGEAAARVLVDQIWDQRAPMLTGPEALGVDDVRQILSREVPVEVACRSLSALRLLLRLRFRQKLSWRQCLDGIRRSRRLRDDRSAQVSDDLRLLLGRAPRKLDEFVRDLRQEFHPGYESPETTAPAPVPVPALAAKSRKPKRRAVAC
jgi:uncharacterized protein YbjT (DUF2867 family)